MNFQIYKKNQYFTPLILNFKRVINWSKNLTQAEELVRDFSANHFGGGGHHNAAGGASTNTLDEVVQKIISLLPEYASDLDYIAPWDIMFC